VFAGRNCSGAVRFDLSGRPDGTYTVRIVAIDAAGNVSDALVITYVLGTPTPTPPPAGGTGSPGATGGGGGGSGATPSSGSGGTPATPAAQPPLPGAVRQTIQRLNQLAGLVKSSTRHTVQHVEHAVATALPVIHDRFTENVSHAVQGVVNAVSTAGGGTGFPLLLLVVVLGFLVVQNRIDRRDPKLALASVAADDTVEFLPPPSRGGRR
jgi:hypothetical protein